MTKAEQRDLIARYVAAYNRFDVDGMLALVADDVRFEDASGGRVTASAAGAAEFRALAERAAGLFREREQRVVGYWRRTCPAGRRPARCWSWPASPNSSSPAAGSAGSPTAAS